MEVGGWVRGVETRRWHSLHCTPESYGLVSDPGWRTCHYPEIMVILLEDNKHRKLSGFDYYLNVSLDESYQPCWGRESDRKTDRQACQFETCRERRMQRGR